MLEQLQKTGSISQDALRLGFQPTCDKGIANLLKVDDITIEKCADFKERHLERVVEALEEMPDNLLEGLEEDFHRESESYINDYVEKTCFFKRTMRKRKARYLRSLRDQPKRKYEVELIDEGEPTLSVQEGRWYTTLTYKVTAHAWKGLHKCHMKEVEEESYEKRRTVQTNAMKCSVDYVAYDMYCEKYIPDEAAQAAYEALAIGMVNPLVAMPKLSQVSDPPPDPIIVAHVGEQMFIIAWFGYDKENHMNCNV